MTGAMIKDNLSYEDDYNIGLRIIKDIGDILNRWRDNSNYGVIYNNPRVSASVKWTHAAGSGAGGAESGAGPFAMQQISGC